MLLHITQASLNLLDGVLKLFNIWCGFLGNMTGECAREYVNERYDLSAIEAVDKALKEHVEGQRNDYGFPHVPRC